MSASKLKRNKPIIGVTGAIGSGKSTVARLFSDWGAFVISGDEAGHRVLKSSLPVRRRLANAFGSDIVISGSVNRALLAERAFASKAKVLTLNRIVHPALIRLINSEIDRGARDRNSRAVVIDAALLVEWGMGKIPWDHLVGVSAPYELRMRRLRARGLTSAQIRRFSTAQMPWQEKRAYCDFIVKNDSSLTILRRRARLCWDKMLSSD